MSDHIEHRRLRGLVAPLFGLVAVITLALALLHIADVGADVIVAVIEAVTPSAAQ